MILCMSHKYALKRIVEIIQFRFTGPVIMHGMDVRMNMIVIVYYYKVCFSSSKSATLLGFFPLHRE